MPSPLAIELLPQAADGFRAMIAGRDCFRRQTGFDLAEGMLSYARHFTEPYLATLTGLTPWTFGYLAVDSSQRLVVGTAGFKGPPDSAGVVEIAYGTAPELENRGYATATARALSQLAYRQPDVRLVIAHTLAEANASGRVLTKCGFLRTGEVIDPEDGPVWRWELARPSPNAC